MTTTYPRECARCGRHKPPWFKYCPKCYAFVQIEQLKPNTCDDQDCNEVIADDHYLCRAHWQQSRDGKISECPECRIQTGELNAANTNRRTFRCAGDATRSQRTSRRGSHRSIDQSRRNREQPTPAVLMTATTRTTRRPRTRGIGSTGRATGSVTIAAAVTHMTSSRWST